MSVDASKLVGLALVSAVSHLYSHSVNENNSISVDATAVVLAINKTWLSTINLSTAPVVGS